jgi:hypothetical protein
MPLDQLIAPASSSLSGFHEFASISAHFALISWFFNFAASRFAFVRSSLWARKHLLTSVFAPLHMPIAFHKKPLAWHSSRMSITSSQAVVNESYIPEQRFGKEIIPRLSFVCK